MCPLPNVNITQTNGNLGRGAGTDDGISLLIVTGVSNSPSFVLNDVIGPFKSLSQFESLGITEDYDTTNTCQAWRQIKDFYSEAGKGVELYVMVVAKTVLMADMTDTTNVTTGVKKALLAAGGRIRLVGISRVPDGAYTPTFATQLEQDILDAIDNAQVLAAAEFTAFRPCQVLIEGRNWQGNVGSSLDLRDATDGPNANRVSLVIGQDLDVANDTDNAQAKYAALGKALGRVAKIQVHRNIGRVKDGALVGIVNAGFSNNAAVGTLTDADQDTLNEKGYIFLRSHTGKAGWFFNDDHTACPLTDDYSSIGKGRAADKVSRIARNIYVEEILNDLEIDADTGKLAASTCKHFEGIVEDEVQKQMISKGELTAVGAFCDADVNVIQTDLVTIEINIVPRGMARQIKVTQSYAASISQ
jgi:hypothetical protein